MVKRVQLTQGEFALVDDADYDTVTAAGKWRLSRRRHTSYAIRTVRIEGRRTTQAMHSFISGHSTTDHRNGNGLDNRRANLRDVDGGANQHNSRRSRDNTSGYKGVHWHGPSGKFRAAIQASGTRRWLGQFADPEEAGRVYDEAARELFGEFAALNFPRPGERSARSA